jgi:hypothetical protein
VINDSFQWVVYGWGVDNITKNTETNWLNVPVMSGIISIAVQIFFGWRIWILGNSLILAGIVSTVFFKPLFYMSLYRLFTGRDFARFGSYSMWNNGKR